MLGFEQFVPLLAHEKRYEPLKAALSGLIFDSAPCFMTTKSGRKAMTSGTSFPIKQLLELVFVIILGLTLLLAGNPSKRFWQCMLDERLAVPRLHFYSMDDELCDPQELEMLLDKKRQQGLELIVNRWDHSSHCAHLRRHPDEYIAALQTFLAKVSKR